VNVDNKIVKHYSFKKRAEKVPSSAWRLWANYLPRQCGIATFTTDICVKVRFGIRPIRGCIACRSTIPRAGYPYPARVRFELTEKDIRSYRRAATFLNINNVTSSACKHEVWNFLEDRAGSTSWRLAGIAYAGRSRTLHTILKDPNPESDCGCSRKSRVIGPDWWWSEAGERRFCKKSTAYRIDK